MSTITDRDDGLVFKKDYFDDPAAWHAFAALLKDVFGIDLGPLALLGGHDRTSMPSALFDADGACVANFTAFSMPLVVNGRPVKAAGLQSGAVRPDYRGRGLFRDLTRATLDRCAEAGFEAIALYTDKPGLYEPYGFRIVPQSRFSGPPPQLQKTATLSRRLDIRNSDDLALVQTALAQRLPVSARFAVADQATMFLLNAYYNDRVMLDYLADHRVVIAWQASSDGAFELLDIVGPEIPSLDAILGALDLRPTHVIVHFPPDRLDWQGAAEPIDGDLVFMMRCAPELIPVEPFSLSPMAEF